jgi:hypothetical protein
VLVDDDDDLDDKLVDVDPFEPEMDDPTETLSFPGDVSAGVRFLIGDDAAARSSTASLCLTLSRFASLRPWSPSLLRPRPLLSMLSPSRCAPPKFPSLPRPPPPLAGLPLPQPLPPPDALRPFPSLLLPWELADETLLLSLAPVFIGVMSLVEDRLAVEVGRDLLLLVGGVAVMDDAVSTLHGLPESRETNAGTSMVLPVRVETMLV